MVVVMEGWDGMGGGSIFREEFGRELVWFWVEKFFFFYLCLFYLDLSSFFPNQSLPNSKMLFLCN